MDRPSYSFGEEMTHSVLHGLGALASMAAWVVMVVLAAQRGSTVHVVACAVFGATLVLLYTSSTLYHSIPMPRARRIFQIFDHCSIYLLIAGTYTPFTLVVLGGTAGWSLFGVVWGLAIVGIVLRATLPALSHRISIVLYLGMGWSVLAVASELLARLDETGQMLLIGGGLAYTAGVPFYAVTRVRYFHAVWHVFVLVGSTLHVLAVLWSVVPAAAA